MEIMEKVPTARSSKREPEEYDLVILGGDTGSTIAAWTFAEAQPLTHIEALELGELPEHLIVLGAGYVGIELAQAMRRFGSKVTVMDRNHRVRHREDEDVSSSYSP